MKVVDQSYQIIYPNNCPNGLIDECKKIELAGRTCYKSEDKITDDSWKKFVTMLRDKQHGAMLEHSSITIKFITSRGVLAELTRHRLASYAVESTRYCNYSKEKFDKEIAVIDPFISEGICDSTVYKEWKETCEKAEESYFKLLEYGYTPQIARSVLPTCLKTEITMTMNFRELIHILKLRCSKSAHPEIRALFLPLYKYLKEVIPEVFLIKDLEE
jgi:thymidylate synthase (FAD)